MADQPSGETPEQRRLREALIAKHGELVFQQAAELSGLQICMLALGVDSLTPEERARAYRQASEHLQNLLETVMPPAVMSRVVECAQRIDSSIEVAVLDDVEKRDGLTAGMPPLWPTA